MRGERAGSLLVVAISEPGSRTRTGKKNKARLSMQGMPSTALRLQTLRNTSAKIFQVKLLTAKKARTAARPSLWQSGEWPDLRLRVCRVSGPSWV